MSLRHLLNSAVWAHAQETTMFCSPQLCLHCRPQRQDRPQPQRRDRAAQGRRGKYPAVSTASAPLLRVLQPAPYRPGCVKIWGHWPIEVHSQSLYLLTLPASCPQVLQFHHVQNKLLSLLQFTQYPSLPVLQGANALRRSSHCHKGAGAARKP